MGFFGNVETKLKYRKRDNVYKNSTGTCMYYVDDVYATSYNWWTFVKKIKGKVVFNNYSYSNSTSGHQRAVRNLLEQLKIKVDLTVYTRASLSSTDKLKDALKERIATLAVAQHKLDTQSMSPKARVNREREVNNALEDIAMYKTIGIKFSKAEALEIYQDAIADYEFNAAKEREAARLERQAKKPVATELKEQLNDLSPINYGNAHDELNNLGSI